MVHRVHGGADVPFSTRRFGRVQMEEPAERTDRMKILFYNWVDYLDAEKRGGGVSVYQRNLIKAFADDPEVDAWFLSSGISYDLMGDTPRWDRVRYAPSEHADRRFEIVNSRVLSPSHYSFGHETQIHCPETRAAFLDFLKAHGPFDIVHFNNLEGIPASVLSLKEEYPRTRIVFSLHNYYPVCPQVNLWFQEKENCTDFDEGRKCAACLPHRVEPSVVRHAGAVAYKLKRAGLKPGTLPFDKAFGKAYALTEKARNEAARFYRGAREVGAFSQKVLAPRSGPDAVNRVEPEPRRLRRRREEIVTYLNIHADRILCVSDRVGKVAEKFGIDPDLMETAYIGTLHAQKFADTVPAESICQPDGTVTLAYLGYMRADKGFFFLLDALEALPPLIARRINLLICARRGPQWAMDRLAALGDKFASVQHADGYTHDNLDALLAPVDLGIIPVLWEDNLPQVAIEMHARHIPLITSDLGGARELGNTPEMVFKAGDTDSLHDVLFDVVAGKIDLEEYWTNARAPTSMQEHADALRALYRSLLSAPHAEADRPDAAPDMLQKSQPAPVLPLSDVPGSKNSDPESDTLRRSVTSLDPGRASTQKEGLG